MTYATKSSREKIALKDTELFIMMVKDFLVANAERQCHLSKTLDYTKEMFTLDCNPETFNALLVLFVRPAEPLLICTF